MTIPLYAIVFPALRMYSLVMNKKNAEKKRRRKNAKKIVNETFYMEVPPSPPPGCFFSMGGVFARGAKGSDD